MLRVRSIVKPFAPFRCLTPLRTGSLCSPVYQKKSRQNFVPCHRSLLPVAGCSNLITPHTETVTENLDRSHQSSCRIHFILRDGNKKVINARVGETVLDIAHEHNIDIEGACDASLACSTCHVILDQASFDRLGEPSEREEDLLDMAPYVTDTSRLSCQIRLTEKENDMQVRLPPSTLNFYVDGYCPKPH